jgi:hypothetical protein
MACPHRVRAADPVTDSGKSPINHVGSHDRQIEVDQDGPAAK